MYKKKSQNAVEFLIILAFVLFRLFVFYDLNSERKIQRIEIHLQLLKRQLLQLSFPFSLLGCQITYNGYVYGKLRVCVRGFSAGKSE